MIGYFSLNVPSGLTLYWFINNLLSTAQQMYLKASTNVTIPDMPVDATVTSSTPIIKPKEERVKKVTGEHASGRSYRVSQGTRGGRARALMQCHPGPLGAACESITRL